MKFRFTTMLTVALSLAVGSALADPVFANPDPAYADQVSIVTSNDGGSEISIIPMVMDVGAGEGITQLVAEVNAEPTFGGVGLAELNTNTILIDAGSEDHATAKLVNHYQLAYYDTGGTEQASYDPNMECRRTSLNDHRSAASWHPC